MGKTREVREATTFLARPVMRGWRWIVWVFSRRRRRRLEPTMVSTTDVFCRWKWWKRVMAFVITTVWTEFGTTRIPMTI
jgi:hypothetical protein